MEAFFDEIHYITLPLITYLTINNPYAQLTQNLFLNIAIRVDREIAGQHCFEHSSALVSTFGLPEYRNSTMHTRTVTKIKYCRKESQVLSGFVHHRMARDN